MAATAARRSLSGSSAVAAHTRSPSGRYTSANAFHASAHREETPDSKWFVVVTRSGEKVAGILVDALVRQQEVVIKSIGQRLKTIPGIAGATEVGEGEIVLVIDVGSLIEAFGGRAREARAQVGVG